MALSSLSIRGRMSRAPMVAAERLTSTWRPAAARRMACVVTQRSISVMRPYFSATGRKVPGEMISPVRLTMRRRSSSPGVPPLAEMMGWE